MDCKNCGDKDIHPYLDRKYSGHCSQLCEEISENQIFYRAISDALDHLVASKKYDKIDNTPYKDEAIKILEEALVRLSYV